MTENLAEDQGPNLIKKGWSPQSFSNRTVRPEKLHILMEAARSTRSYKNEQPWNFIIVTSEDADSYNNLLACLPEGNASWARHAPVLMLSVARLNFESDSARNKHAFRDLAQAVSNIAFLAKSLGLLVRQTAGFDAAMTRRRFQIPEGHDPVAVIALGYPLESPSAVKSFKRMERRVCSDRSRALRSPVYGGSRSLQSVVPCPNQLHASGTGRWRILSSLLEL